ncbi:MAG: trigger factor [Patescibacteria group bacterium]
MKFNTKKIDGKIEISVEISKESVESYFKIAAEQLSKDMKVKGFRPGKVPVDIVEKEIGSEKLYGEAANVAIQRTLPGIIKDEELEVIGQPDIVVKKIVKNQEIEYMVTFQLMPEVDLGEYKGLKAIKKEIKIDDSEIEKSIKYLLNSRTKFITVNREAKKVDKVEVDFEIKHDNVKIEDGESKNHPLVLGESNFLPGFEEKLEKMKANDEKEFSLKIPKDWKDKRIAGKELDFKVKMKLVQEREIPELNDEFAKSLGTFKSVKELKDSIKQGILTEKEVREKERIRLELIEKVVDNTKLDIPDVLIDQEVQKMEIDLRNSINSMGLDFDTYLKQLNKKIEDIKEEWKEQAEKRVKIGLCLREIIKKENINVDDKEIEEKINQDLKQYPNVEEVRKNIDMNQLKEYTKNILLNEKTFELLEKESK